MEPVRLVRNNPLAFVDPDGRELRLAVFNSSQYSKETVRKATAIVVGRFQAAGLQNVTADVRQGIPSSGDHLRQGLVGIGALLSGSQHSHMVEVRPGRNGKGIANSAIKPGEAGRNFTGSSAIDASHVAAKTDDQNEAAVALANLMPHEIAHDVFQAHSNSLDNVMYRYAGPDWLLKPDVSFSPAQAEGLRKRFNTEEEQREWEKQQKEKGMGQCK